MIKNKVVKNASWIIGCKIFQAILSIIVSMLTARYLGPSTFGVINYASSLVAFVTPLMQLGLTGVLVRELVTHPDKEGETLGTSVFMSLISAVLSIGGVVAFAAIANAGERVTIIVCALYSLLLLSQALETIQYWFQAKYLSKYTSILMLVAYSVTTLYKIYLIITEKSVYWFALSHAIDYLIVAVGLLIFYKKFGNQKLSVSIKRAGELLSKSKYYILSDLMLVVFAQVSKILLKLLIDEAAVGYYSAALACIGATSFVYLAIIDSMRPLIFESRENGSRENFEKNVKILYSIMIFVSFMQSIVFCLGAELIIKLLYGTEFLPAVNVLRILAWYTPFSYLGNVRNIWILAENKQKYLWIINLLGAIFSIVTNFALIPFMGVFGAAVSAVATQGFTNLIVGFIIKPIRYNNKLLLGALNPKTLIEGAKKILKRK